MMRLDYFYNTEGENFRFYQIPALLLEEEEYRGISDTAKILYGVLLSRLALSRKNSWIEKDTGRLYITYNLKQLVEKLGRSDRTISKAMKQLSEVGLIEKKKRGQGKPDIIYVMNFTAVHSVYDCLDKSTTYLTDFTGNKKDERWIDWLSMTIEKNAYYPIKKKPEKEGQILTLSTCSGKKKGDDYRLVVNAVIK